MASAGSGSGPLGGGAPAGGGPASDGGDFLSRYRLVSSKLKKRFLRKPNVSEAGEQFGQLGKELRAQDCLPYAAWCQLAVARCQQSLFHGPGEALALSEAGRLFLRQEREARLRLACPAAWGEALQAACGCYALAARLLGPELGQPAAAAGLCLELAAALRELGQPGAAAAHFQRAAELQLPLLPLDALGSLGQAASCQLLARDYDGALGLFTRMQRLAARRTPGPAPGAFLDVAARCEVSRVLLLLLLQPPPPKLLPEHARTLERYCWEACDDDDGPARDGGAAGAGGAPGPLPEGLFLLLQSLVLAAHEKDVEAVKALQAELWPLLSAEQNHLLHLVLQEMIAPSGRGL
ncbi:40-kDa huntingtin-associated protein [Ornithorhynchus anatinus]|uniref:40-kDa huntingtin-associated protein n=1 Tax=Ornithorhynchus anatinus TaxID=9258 RepID=UPI0010A90412|nr:40-kDa huntingtin-associated protein [Ornithorhynchus anatinus]